MPKIHLVTSCSNSKYRGKQTASLHEVQDPQCLDDAGQKWRELLGAIGPEDRVPAVQRYKGGHWSIAKSCIGEVGVELWVISAGLGLLHSSTPIPDYQATFALGSEDSIPRLSEKRQIANQRWWSNLVEYSGERDLPVSLTQLMSTNSQDLFVICGSNDYIDAVEPDLAKGVAYLRDPSLQLLIITSGEPKWAPLAPFHLRSHRGMTEALGCNMLTLNIALAKQVLRWIRDGAGNTLERIKVELAPTLTSELKVEEQQRTRRTETEVLSYILDVLKQDPSMSASRMLRQFRSEGNSFEQKRFMRVFREAQAQCGI